jgi:hypothetical protein
MWFKLRKKNKSRVELDHGDPPDSVDVWRSILVKSTSWVLYKNGTCVILKDVAGNLAEEANKIMKQYGPVYPGSPAGDFTVMSSREVAGWVVGSHHRDILTYVGPEEMGAKPSSDAEIGLIGREKRHRDSQELQIIHMEDRRNAA